MVADSWPVVQLQDLERGYMADWALCYWELAQLAWQYTGGNQDYTWLNRVLPMVVLSDV